MSGHDQSEANGNPASAVSIAAVLGTLPDAPVASTRNRNWTGITVDVHSAVRDYRFVAPARDHHLIAINIGGTGRLVQRRLGERFESLTSKGSIIVMPAGLASTWEGHAESSVRLRVQEDLIKDAGEASGSGPFELVNHFETRDRFVETIGRLFANEIHRSAHPSQSLLGESLSMGLAAHLWRDYNSHDRKCAKRTPDSVAAVKRAIEYIRSNYTSVIRLDHLASAAGVSRFHLGRLFKTVTGTSAMQFVQRTRIERAEVMIRGSDVSIAETALLLGFADQSHFNRCFKRHTGMTPASYARQHRIVHSTR